ncbi:hemerythrin domain-containing protein [uncultured Jatrophihabitans sp.]|uniref:hemerythrin domain-containing protein n=1 Tax=uncultured Jatrophihabitans sp. TaxID=1610747 RepID=UPI0035CADDF8
MAELAPGHDVVDVLTEDHHLVLELVTTISDFPDAESRRSTVDTVIAELVRHSVAEEMFVYPAMRHHLADGDELVRHDIEEHQELEVTMKALEGADPSGLEFNELVDTLEEQLRHHATDEEEEQFPKLRQQLPEDVLVELGKKVVAAKELAPTRPHPASPHSELFHKTLGTGVGMVDKLRDVLSGRARNV